MLKLRNLVIGGAVATLLGFGALSLNKKPISIESKIPDNNRVAWDEAHQKTEEFIRRNPKTADALNRVLVKELAIELKGKSPNEGPQIQTSYTNYNLSGLFDFMILNAGLAEGLPRVESLIKPHHDIIDPFNIVPLETRAREKAKVLLQDPVYLKGLAEAYKFEKLDSGAVSTTLAMAILSEATNIKDRTNSVSLDMVIGWHFDSTRTNPPIVHMWVGFNGKSFVSLFDTNSANYVPIAKTRINFDTSNNIIRSNPQIRTYPEAYLRAIDEGKFQDK